MPSDIDGLSRGSIMEISRDGIARFQAVVKDDDDATTPTKRRRTTSVSLEDDPFLGFTLILTYRDQHPPE